MKKKTDNSKEKLAALLFDRDSAKIHRRLATSNQLSHEIKYQKTHFSEFLSDDAINNLLVRNIVEEIRAVGQLRLNIDKKCFYSDKEITSQKDFDFFYKRVSAVIEAEAEKIRKTIKKMDCDRVSTFIETGCFQRNPFDSFLPKANEVKKNALMLLSDFKRDIEIMQGESVLKSIAPPKKKYDIRYPNKKAADAIIANNKWENITIQFLNNQEVQIVVDRLQFKTDFRDMGFQDKRQEAKTNKQWELLMELSEKGTLSRGNPFSGKTTLNMTKLNQQFGTNLTEDELKEKGESRGYSIINIPDKRRKRKQDLSTHLKAYFQINNDPFEPYKEAGAYSVRFNLIPC